MKNFLIVMFICKCLVKKIHKYIIDDKLSEAIQLLEGTASSKDGIKLAGRLNDLKQKHTINGEINYEEYKIEKARIREALMEITRRLESNCVKPKFYWILGLIPFFLGAFYYIHPYLALSPNQKLSNTNQTNEYTEIILDCSRSMDHFFDGMTKWDAAIKVLNECLYMNNTAYVKLAFRKFGGNCGLNHNSDLLVPFGQDNSQIILDTISKIDLLGKPTLFSGLRKSLGDFQIIDEQEDTILKRIIVITGNTDACVRTQTYLDLVSDAIKARKIKLDFHVIGMNLRNGDAKELEELCNMVSGKLDTVNTLNELKSTVEKSINSKNLNFSNANRPKDKWKITQDFSAPFANINSKDSTYEFIIDFIDDGTFTANFANNSNNELSQEHGFWEQKNGIISFSFDAIQDMVWEGIVMNGKIVGRVNIANVEKIVGIGMPVNNLNQSYKNGLSNIFEEIHSNNN